MVKQDDIAKILNISRTTVARALYGKGNVKPETKKKILDLCEELGYVRNPISTSLALKYEKNIYAFIVKGRNKYYSETIKKGLKAAQKDLSMYKFNLYIIETHIDCPEEQLEKLLKTIRTKEVDGIIITPLLKEEVKKIKKENININFLVLDLILDKNTCSIYSNYHNIGRLMANILLNSMQKDEKILLIETEDDKISARETFQGMFEKLNEDRKCEIVGPIFVSNLEVNVEEKINGLLTSDIKAIYTSRFLNNVMEFIIKEGKYDIKVVAMGLSDMTKTFIKEGKVLGAVTPDYYKMGYMAINIIFDYLYKGIKPEKLHVEYENKIFFQENL